MSLHQTRDRLFDAPRVKRPTVSAKPELALTPRPGEPLRWCAHDRKLLFHLMRPDVHQTLSVAARGFVLQLQGQKTVAIEQVCWLRGLARRVSFAEANEEQRGGRAIRLDGSLVK